MCWIIGFWLLLFRGGQETAPKIKLPDLGSRRARKNSSQADQQAKRLLGGRGMAEKPRRQLRGREGLRMGNRFLLSGHLDEQGNFRAVG